RTDVSPSVKKRPAGSLPPSKPPPARHRLGARSARRQRCPAILSQTAIESEGLLVWLPSLFSRSGTGRRPAARKWRGASLCLEVLENRLAPAVTLLVTGPGDAVALDGVVTLREALMAANTNTTVNEAAYDGSGGTDSIRFDTAGAFATPRTIPL